MSDTIVPKKCKDCGQEYPATREYFQPNGKHLRPYCRPCWRVRERAYRASEHGKAVIRAIRQRRDPEIVKAEKKRSNQRHPESRRRRGQRYVDRRIAENPDWQHERYMSQRDDILERCKIWYTNNRERFNSRMRRRYATNPIVKLKAATYRHNRRATMASAEGLYTETDLINLYEEQSGLCAYCGIRLFDHYHIEHMQPLSRGGTNWPENLSLTCPECNLSKGSKTVEEWRRVRGW